MKKRFVRVGIYFTLACFTAVVLTHPYVWQSIFGPTVKGEPLWAWQQELRVHFDFGDRKPTRWTNIRDLLSWDTKPTQWIGYYPRKDPEMLPVLVSLANDGDEQVRGCVARDLSFMPPTEANLATLARMLDDPHIGVRAEALLTVRRLAPNGAPALTKLREVMRNDPHPMPRLFAALAIIRIDQPTAEALTAVRDGMKSSILGVRLMAFEALAFGGMNEKFNQDKEIFAILIDRSQNDPNHHGRSGSIAALRVFGKKAVPHLLVLLQEMAQQADRARVINTLGAIGSDAAAAISTLEKHRDDPDPEIRMLADRALKQIDPLPAGKK